MGFRAMMDRVPLLLAFLLTAVLFLVCWEVGFRLGRSRREAGAAGEALEGQLVGAVLALLAFILGLTFSMAESRFAARRVGMLDEAVILRDAYLRVGLVAEPQRSEVRGLLRRYLDDRLTASRSGDLASIDRRAVAWHDSLWTHAVAMGTQDRSDVTVMAIEGIDEVVGSHVRRSVLVRAVRVPDPIWLALYGLGALGMVMVGHQHGTKRDRQPFGVVALVLAFAFTIAVIDDIDRPLEGFLTVSQRPLVELRAWMDSTRAP